MNGGLRVTVLATGIETAADKKAKSDDKAARRAAAATQTTPAPRAYGTQSFEQARQAATASAASARTYTAQPVVADDVEVDLQRATPYRQTASTRMQAQIQGDSFIPPQPVEADAAPSHDTVSYSQMTAGVAAPKARATVEYVEEYVEEVAEIAPAPQPVCQPAPVDVGIPAGVAPMAAPVLNPQPRRAEPAVASASLFERITRRVRQTLEGTGGSDVEYVDQPQYAPVRGGAQPMVTSQPIPQQAAAAPVEVSRPVKANGPQAELDLEIPAFLRRQAS